MVRFRLPDGRIIGANDLPQVESDTFIVVSTDQGLILHFFQKTEPNPTHVASIGVRYADLPDLLAKMTSAAKAHGVEWENVEIVPLSDPKDNPTH